MSTFLERLSDWNRTMNDIPRRLLLIAAVILLCGITVRLIPYLWPFLLAMLFAALLEPVARLLRKALKRLKAARVIATVLCVILLFGVLTAAIYWGSGRVVREGINLLRSTPDLVSRVYSALSQKINELYADYQHLLPEDFLTTVNNALSNMTSTVISTAGNLSTRIAGFTINTATSLPIIILSICFTIMGTFYFSYDRERITAFFSRTVPEKTLGGFHMIKSGVFTAIFGQVKAQIFISFVLMLIIMGGFVIMKKPYALLLGFLIGLADVLPVIGAGLFLNSWAIVALLLGDYYTAVGMVLLYLVVLTVRQIIEPRIVGKQLGLYPLVTMISMYVGFKITGTLGLLAGPLVANICKVVLDADAGKLNREKTPSPLALWREKRRQHKKTEKK
ncbi:MAG: sporulation integral membrane protein YtvI [Clostridia bacterium]|nr:sporulation integral membrane protein YtvI [Clostridia bacterium]